MRLFDQFGDYLKALRVHLFGRGALSLVVLAAGALGGPTAALVAVIGGVGLTVVNRLYRERLYEDGMVELYRDDLAAQFGIAPDQVTRGHLKEAAKSNDVIDQALQRQRQKTWLAVGTAAAAGFVAYGLLTNVFGIGAATAGWLQEALGPTMGQAANLIGIGAVAGTSSMVVSQGLRGVVRANTMLGKAAAHDRILEMEFDVRRGRGVSKEQVYGVMVAADAGLQQAIIHRFGKRYRHMHPHEKSVVLQDIGVAADMQAVADQINRGEIRPGRLAYMLQDATNFARTPRPVPTEEAALEDAPERSNFVEKLGLASREQASFREQLATERASANHGMQGAR